MLKKTITYEDFNGEKRTEDFYFNVSKAELVEMEMSEKDGFGATLKQIVAAQDGRGLIKHFKQIIGSAYGIRSDDGKFFRKTPEIQNDFLNSAAYDTLFMEFMTSEEAAMNFVMAILPKDMIDALNTEIKTVSSNKLETVATLPEAPASQ